MNNFCTFYIVRHGESENNKAWRENTIKVFKNVDESGSELNEAGIVKQKKEQKTSRTLNLRLFFLQILIVQNALQKLFLLEEI